MQCDNNTEKQKELDYISMVFKSLSVDKKDNLLETARLLLTIQDNNCLSAVTKPIQVLSRTKGNAGDGKL